MPYKNKADRKYDQSAKYENTPEQVKNREARNKARTEMIKKGRVHKGDGKDVDHIQPLSKGGAPAEGNLRVQSVHDNRSYNRNSDHSVKLRTSKKK